ncbi:MAG: hypothetical protein VXB74_08230, partial [Deltaproteobacteria bacterium]
HGGGNSGANLQGPQRCPPGAGVALRCPWARGHPGQGDENDRGVSNGCELTTSKCSLTVP